MAIFKEDTFPFHQDACLALATERLAEGRLEKGKLIQRAKMSCLGLASGYGNRCQCLSLPHPLRYTEVFSAGEKSRLPADVRKVGVH